MSQFTFNNRVLSILELLIIKQEGRLKYNEPKHGIKGTELGNLWKEAFDAQQRMEDEKRRKLDAAVASLEGIAAEISK